MQFAIDDFSVFKKVFCVCPTITALRKKVICDAEVQHYIR